MGGKPVPFGQQSKLFVKFESPSPTVAALTLLAGTPAPTFTGMIGAARAVTLHRYGLLLDEPIRRRREAAVRPD
jgi:heme exporter protein CcmB